MAECQWKPSEISFHRKPKPIHESPASRPHQHLPTPSHSLDVRDTAQASGGDIELSSGLAKITAEEKLQCPPSCWPHSSCLSLIHPSFLLPGAVTERGLSVVSLGIAQAEFSAVWNG